jgi:hypothetical protein
MKTYTLLLAGILFFMFSQCNKSDEQEFTYCTGCPLSAWVGDYQGSGTYYTFSSNETFEGVETSVTITNPYDSLLKINIDAPDYINEIFSKSKTTDEHYLTTGSGSRTLDLNLSSNALDYRLNGTLKFNQFDNKDSTWKVVKSLTFQVDKSLN